LHNKKLELTNPKLFLILAITLESSLRQKSIIQNDTSTFALAKGEIFIGMGFSPDMLLNQFQKK